LQLFFLGVVKILARGLRKEARNARRPNMKAKLTLIASALLLMSNTAGAQEQQAPSAGEQEAPSAKTEEAPSAGAQEQEAPSTKMTNEEISKLVAQIVQEVMSHRRQRMMDRGMMDRGMMHYGMRYSGQMRMRVMMILMDTDGDGALSLEEVQAGHARIFKAIDADKDGKVTLTEIETFFRGGSPTSDDDR
jgi:EF hand